MLPVLDNLDSATAVKMRLLAMIKGGHLPADGRLPTERELCLRFSAGRRAVRRALASLEAEGLVWRRQGKGTFAGQPPDPTGVLAAAIAGQTRPVEVMEARLCIEPELAALCATHASPRDICRMRHLAQRRLEADDPDLTELWDGALHRLIASSAGNRPLLTAFALLDEIRSQRDWQDLRARARSSASLRVTVSEHHRIIDAIESGDAEAARIAMRDHLQTRFDAMKRELEADGLWRSSEERVLTPHD